MKIVMNNNPLILTFGEVLWDMLPSGKLVGGAPANVALRLTERGLKTLLISRIGSDALGDELYQILQEKGIDLSLLQRDTKLPTGTVGVTLSQEGNAGYDIHKHVAYDAIELTPKLKEVASRATIICFGTLAQRSAVSRATLRSILSLAPQATKVLDINLRKDCFKQETVDESLSHADVLKLNKSEVAYVAELVSVPYDSTKAFSQALMKKYNLHTILITLGEEGVEAFSCKDEHVFVPTKQISVVDTIGSGDAFTAGYVSEYVAGKPLFSCCYRGNTLGVLAATKKGGMGVITPEEVAAWEA
jgi:fructokinase